MTASLLKSVRLLAGLLAGALLVSASVSMAEDDNETGRVPMPLDIEAKGDKCVEPTDVMRRNHMKFILHQRDETMHRGVRTEQHSLAECINCHVTPDAEGKVASHKDPEHFCNSCHTYAAVNIDCFQCHTSQPEPGGHGEGTQASNKLQRRGDARLESDRMNEMLAKQAAGSK